MGDRLQCRSEEAERPDVIELASFDNKRDLSQAMAALPMPGEQAVLKPEGQRTDPIHVRIVVHLDMAV